MAPVEVSYWRKRSATKNPQKLSGLLEFTDDKLTLRNENHGLVEMYPIRTQKKREMLEGCKKGGLIDTFDTWCVQMNEAFGGKKLMGVADASGATSPIKRAAVPPPSKKAAKKPRNSLAGGHPNKPAHESFNKIGDFFAKRGPKSKQQLGEVSSDDEVITDEGSNDDPFDDYAGESKVAVDKRRQSKWVAKEAAAKQALIKADIAGVPETESDDEPVITGESGSSKSRVPANVSEILSSDDEAFTPAQRPNPQSRDLLSDEATKPSRTLNANKRNGSGAASGSLNKKGKRVSKNSQPDPGQPKINTLYNKKPDLKELMRSTVEEEEEEARTKKQMKELVDKDWNRDFGHCFPNLYEGLDEDIAMLQAKRQREEMLEEEGTPDGEDMYD